MKKFSIIIIFIAIGMISLGVFYEFSNKNDKIVDVDTTNIKVELGDTKTINPCIDNANCLPGDIVDYDFLTFSSGISEFDSVIDKINKDTKKYYNEALSSKSTDSTCASTYKNNFQFNSDYSLYKSKDYLSVSVIRSKLNLCTRENTPYPRETFIWGIKENKFLSQEEVKEAFGLTDEKINSAIAANVELLNSYSDNKISFENIDVNKIDLFFDHNGKLLISYYSPEKQIYYSTNIE